MHHRIAQEEEIRAWRFRYVKGTATGITLQDFEGRVLAGDSGKPLDSPKGL
jgi:hypothetical protein